MNASCEQNQIKERERKQRQARQGSNGARAREACAKQDEMADVRKMPAIQPKIIAIFIQDENLAGKARGQHPFPFGHDGFGRANDSDYGIAIGVEQAVELLARTAVGIIGDAVNSASIHPEFLGHAGVTGEQVGGHIRMNAIEAGEQVFEKIAASAFDQQHPRERRNASTEKIAQSLLFHVEQDSVLLIYKPKACAVLNSFEKRRDSGGETRQQRVFNRLIAV